MAVSLGELAVRFGCELRGDPQALVDHVATLANAGARSLAFLANPRYRPQLTATRAAVVVLDPQSADSCPTQALVCENPYATYARIAAVLHPAPVPVPGVHPTALVAHGARVDPTAQVAALASIGAGSVVGARSYVGPHCHLDEGVILAEDVRLVARVTVCRGVQLGARVVVHPGAVIGSDGFGFASERGTWLKVPQLGGVRVEADVEIGANTTIDRGAIEDTVIETGAKLDNLIQVGHNVRIGAHSALAACVGVSGSTTIGKRCMIGGMVGIAGHLAIADDVVITGLSLVSHSITQPGVYSGAIPLEEAHTWRRLVARFKRSGRLESRVKRMERAAGVKSGLEENHD
ncbi:MAG: UDP-3-O-(3-hydroxymyristoyl)glucosamine N-acyltransferase [Steroidobacterales bacterium]